MRATMRNWFASELFAGNGVDSVGAPASAPLSASLASIERATTRACSASNRSVEAAVIRLRSASEHAVDPNSGALMPFTGTEPFVVTWYCTAERPDRKTALPDTLTQVNVDCPLPAANRSPMRPPQPLVAPSGFEACHADCWSLCENSFGGSRTERARYCAFVVGSTSVPTLSSTASWPASKIGTSGASCGASAYCRPSASAVEGVSAPACSASCGVAIAGRSDWYAA